MGGGGRQTGGYDVFLSYSQAADGQLAPALQRGLERLGARWYRPRALTVFRDETGLSADSSLWGAIERALDRSSWFLLLASPGAARSAWVDREVRHWLESNDPNHLLVAVTDGDWVWNATTSTLEGDAVPDALRNRFDDEPRHVDLNWARSSVELDLHHAKFRAAIAELAAPVHGMAKDELESEHVTEQRRVRRLTRSAIAVLVALLLTSTVFAGLAYTQTRSARNQANRAVAQTLLTESRSQLSARPDLAALAAAESLARRDVPQARAALVEALNADPLLEHVVTLPDDETALGLSYDAAYVVTRDRDRVIHIRSALDGDLLASVELEEDPDRTSLVFSIHRAASALAVVDHGVGDQGQDRVRVVPLDDPRGEWHVDRKDVIDVDWVGADTIAVQSDSATGDEVLPSPQPPGVYSGLTDLGGAPRLELVKESTRSRPTTVTAAVGRFCGGAGSDLGCSTTLVAAPDAGRFAVGTAMVSTADTSGATVYTDRGEPVATVGEGPMAPLSLSGDGRRLYTARGWLGDPEGAPLIAAYDVESREQIWSREGNEVNSTTSRADASDDTAVGTVVSSLADGSLVLATNSSGDRIVAGSWMMGPVLTGYASFPLRLDPPRSTFAWADPYGDRGIGSPGGAGGRLVDTAMAPDGNSMARLVDDRVLWIRTSILPSDYDCALMQRVLGELRFDSANGAVVPACRHNAPSSAGDGPNRPLSAPADSTGLVAPNGTMAVITDLPSGPTVSIMDPRGQSVTTVTPVRLPKGIADLIESNPNLGVEFPPSSAYFLSDTHLARVTQLFGPDTTSTVETEWAVDIEWWSAATGAELDHVELAGTTAPPDSGTVASPVWIDGENQRVVVVDAGRLVEYRLDAPGERRESTPIPGTDAGTALGLTGTSGFTVVSEPDSTGAGLSIGVAGEPLAIYDGSLEQLPIDPSALPANTELLSASSAHGLLAFRTGNEGDAVEIIRTKDGSRVASIDAPGLRTAQFAGSGVVVATDASLRYHNLSDDTVAILAELDPTRDLGISQLIDLGDGEVLTLTGDGVRHYIIDGNLTERACDRFAAGVSNKAWEFESIAGPPRACPG